MSYNVSKKLIKRKFISVVLFKCFEYIATCINLLRAVNVIA